jgi:hypothetical protein
VRTVRLIAVAALALGLGAATNPAAAADSGALLKRLRGPRVAAHRGGYGFPDANTVARFEVARGLGADIVETDLRLSKDGVVFMFHDSLLDRKTTCTGPIASHTAAEIGRCHLRGLDRGPDRFESALRWSRGRVVIDAEIKTPEVTRPAIDLVRRHRAYDWVYFQVGNGMRTYRAVRDYDRRIAVEAGPRGPNGERLLAELLASNDPHLVLIQLHPDFLSSRILGSIHASEKLASLNAWLLAPEETGASCARVFELGIDVAVTNAAGSCAKQRDEARASSRKSAPAAPAARAP